MIIRRISCFIFTLILLKYNDARPPRRPAGREYDKLLKNLVAGKGLYFPTDKVTILNATNFRSTIYGTKNSWMVEFYNTYCGHCQAFAPKFKALAVDIYDWRNVVTLAVFDCAPDENSPICRDYDIMQYPTIKFFQDHAPASALGIEVTIPPDGSPSLLARSFAGILKMEQLEGRGVSWPNLNPLRNSDLEGLSHSPGKYVFLVFEEENSELGTQLILDFSSVPEVTIRTVLSENEAAALSLGVRRFPSVVFWSGGSAPGEILRPVNRTRVGFRDALLDFLEAKGLEVSVRRGPPPKPSPLPMPDPNDVEAWKTKMELEAIKSQGDIVFLADLEGAVRYMLSHEISSRKVIRGEQMTALKNFLQVLAKYFPAGEAGIAYLRELKRKVMDSGDEISGIRFKKLVTEDGGLESVLTTENNFIGCRGSTPNLRGFPCSVWTLFHFLTVSALRATDPLEVLSAMLGYITNFFGCTECANHFKEMAERSMKAKATDQEQAVLWLWSAHNEVNKRLSGAPTDDPEFPKVQYPTTENCPKCRSSAGHWSNSAVLAYLKNKYHQDNLSYQGSNNQIADHLNPGQVNPGLVHSSEDSSSKFGRYFNSLDISICITLYALSAIICAVVCWKFILRKHYRKKFF